MFKNYMLSSVRSLGRKKGYLALNIAGLALGLSAVLLVFLKINYELSYDSLQQNAERLYRVNTIEITSGIKDKNAGTHFFFPEAFRTAFPEMEAVVPVYLLDNADFFPEDQTERYKFERVGLVGERFFNLFTAYGKDRWLAGNPEKGFTDKNSCILTRSVANNMFGGKAPRNWLGKTLRVNNKTTFKVAGIVEDPPVNSNVELNVLLPYESLGAYDEFYDPEGSNVLWSNNQCFVLLPENKPVEAYNQQMPAFIDRYLDTNNSYEYEFQAFNTLHIDNSVGVLTGATIRSKTLKNMALIGFMLVLTACVNFVNLATAQSVKRAREVGIRKVLGSSRTHLIGYFLTETALITLAAMVLSMSLAELFLLWFHELMDLPESLSLFQMTPVYAFLPAAGIIVALLSGGYPALVLSGYHPLQALAANLSIGKNKQGLYLRRGLVISQFVFTQVLIVGMLVTSQQVNYYYNKPLGFNEESVAIAPLASRDSVSIVQLRDRLMQHGEISHASLALGSAISEANLNTECKVSSVNEPETLNKVIHNEEINVDLKNIDEHYVDTYELKLLAGRKPDRADIENNKMLVNEAFVRKLGLTPEEATGMVIDIIGEEHEIIGVCQNYHISNFSESIGPVAMLSFPEFYYEVAVKINDNLQDGIQVLEKEWENIFPRHVFEYTIFDELVSRQYDSEQKTLQLFRIFSVVAIVIGCLGLLGLVTFLAEQKTLEIGVRKVMGATVLQITWRFTLEFVKLVGIALLIALPLGYLLMDQWLSDFAYRITIGWDIFATTVFISLLIAVITVSWRSMQAALTNPVQALRAD